MSYTGTLTGFDPQDTRSHVMLAIIWTLVPLALIAVALRMYCRHILSKNLGIDDWMTCLSMIIVLVTASLETRMTRVGLGVHKEFLGADQLREYNKLFYISIVFYTSSLYFIKLHVLLQYLRIFSIKMKILTLRVLGGVALCGIGSILLSIFKCNPNAGSFDPRPGACVPAAATWYVTSVGNIVTDIIVFALPLRVLWNLKLNRGTRISLVGVFSLGLFTVCLSIVRVTFADYLIGDDTYQVVIVASWGMAEVCWAIIASCAPCLRPLLKRAFPCLSSGTSNQASGGNNYLRTYGGGHYNFDDLDEAKAGRMKSGSQSRDRSSRNLSGTIVTSSLKGVPHDGKTNLIRSNSTTELTRKELDTIVETMVSSTQSVDKPRQRASEDSGSGTDGASLPIQGTATQPGRHSIRPHHSSHDGANGLRDGEVLGLTLGTYTSVQAAGASLKRPPSALTANVSGIRVKREFAQGYVPS